MIPLVCMAIYGLSTGCESLKAAAWMAGLCQLALSLRAEVYRLGFDDGLFADAFGVCMVFAALAAMVQLWGCRNAVGAGRALRALVCYVASAVVGRLFWDLEHFQRRGCGFNHALWHLFSAASFYYACDMVQQLGDLAARGRPETAAKRALVSRAPEAYQADEMGSTGLRRAKVD